MSKELKCMFCSLGSNRELELGSLHVSGEVIAHFFCMLFSSGLPQNGEDEEGILGFLVPDILKELQRGRKLTCTYCLKKGATIGCSEKRCRRSYHYGCGLKKHALYRFTGDFSSYCHQHREYQQGKGLGEKMECPICMDELIAEPKSAVWAPCCNKKSWFHKICVQQLALSAGYFFKCPLCNDKEVFVEEMQNVGVFVPEKDASWELEPNAFSELERPVRCDASKCKCPEGRKLDDVGTRWEILLCNLCGSSGIHVACGHLPFTCTEWNCPTCIDMLKDSMKRVKQEERERRLRERNSKEKELQATSQGDSEEGSIGASCSKTVFSVEQNPEDAPSPSKRRLLEVTDWTKETPVKVGVTDHLESYSKITYASDSDEEIDVELGEYPVPPHTIIRELEESGEELCKPLKKLRNYAVFAHERMHKLRLTETEIIRIARESPSYRCFPIDKAMVMKFFRYSLPLDKMLQVLPVIRALYSLREALVANALSSSSTKKKSGTSASRRRGHRLKQPEKTPDIKLSFSKSALSKTLTSASLPVKNIHKELEQVASKEEELEQVASEEEGWDDIPLIFLKRKIAEELKQVAPEEDELDNLPLIFFKKGTYSLGNINWRAVDSHVASISGKAGCTPFSPNMGHLTLGRSPHTPDLMDKENNAELDYNLEEACSKLRLSSSDKGTPVGNRRKHKATPNLKDSACPFSPRQPLEESSPNASNIINNFERVSRYTSEISSHQPAEYKYESLSNQMDSQHNSSLQESSASKKRGKYKKRKAMSLENGCVNLESPKAAKYCKGSGTVCKMEIVSSVSQKQQSEHQLKNIKRRSRSYDSSKYIQKTLMSYFKKVPDSKVENAGLTHLL